MGLVGEGEDQQEGLGTGEGPTKQRMHENATMISIALYTDFEEISFKIWF